MPKLPPKVIYLTSFGLVIFISFLAFGWPYINRLIKNEQNKIKNVPAKVNAFLNQSDIATLKSKNFPVYTGRNPPNIAGKYDVNNWTVHFDSGDVYPVGTEIGKTDYTFLNQNKDGTVDVEYETKEVGDKGEGKGSFISGEKNCFTIYINQLGNNSGCNYTQPTLISGCLEKNGIKDWVYANILKTKDTSPICETAVMPVGNVRIIVENDKFVEKVGAI